MGESVGRCPVYRGRPLPSIQLSPTHPDDELRAEQRAAHRLRPHSCRPPSRCLTVQLPGVLTEARPCFPRTHSRLFLLTSLKGAPVGSLRSQTRRPLDLIFPWETSQTGNTDLSWPCQARAYYSVLHKQIIYCLEIHT